MSSEGNKRSDKSKWPYFIAGLLCMSGLLLLSIIFYKERIMFADTALQSVYLIIEKRPCLYWVRPGAILPQIIPLIAIWLHAGLKVILISHSLSFTIFFLLIYLVAFRYSRTTLFFFLVPLSVILTTNESFYWPQPEFQQGMWWLCLYAVFLFEETWWNRRNIWLLHFLSLLWILFFHPVIFFPALFLIIYFYLDRRLLFSKMTAIHLGLCCVAFAIRYAVALCDGYESGKIRIGGLIRENMPKLASLDSVQGFVSRIPHEYAIYILMLVFALVWLIWKRSFLKVVLLSGFTLAYWALIMIDHPSYTRFYIENMLLPLGFVVAVVWIADILPALRPLPMAACLSVLICIRLACIFQLHKDYTGRLSVYEPYIHYAQGKGLNGVFVDKSSVNSQKLITIWASGAESILLSSFNSPDSCIIVQVDDSIGQYNTGLGADTSIVIRYRKWNKSEIPEKYFKLRGGPYEILRKPLE